MVLNKSAVTAFAAIAALALPSDKLFGQSANVAVQKSAGGIATGYNCAKYREQIMRGVVIRYSFVLSDGSGLDSLLIDGSKC